MNKTIEEVAYDFGVRAFKEGKKRIPAHDNKFLKTCLKGCKIGEGLPYHIMWLRGWDNSNLEEEEKCIIMN